MADIRRFFSPKGVKAGKAEKPDKSDKVDNAVKPAKSIKADKPSKADNADNADKAVRPVKPAKAVKAEKPSKADKDVKPAKTTKAMANEAASLKPTRGAGVSSPVLKKHTPSPADSQKPTSRAPEKRSGRKHGRAVVEDDDYEVLSDEGEEEEEWVGDAPDEEEGEWVGDAPDDEEEEPAAKKGRKGKGRGKGAVMTVSAKIPQPAAKANASAGKGKGKGRGSGGGGGWGGFMQERAAPPHKGEKEVPQGPGDALAGVTIVISGVLDSLEREEAEDVIRRHGGRVTGSISGKTSYLLADEDIGGSKSKKAKDLSVPFLTEDALFALIRAKAAADPNWVPPPPPPPPSPKRKPEGSPGGEPSSVRRKVEGGGVESEVWAAKHAPRSLDEVAANPALLNQLREWLKAWPHSGKGKKAVLLSGPPGIGKTSSARLACLEGGWVALEVNASDTRGKASSKVQEGVGGKLANCVKEMVRNRCVGGGEGRPALIMDEVDGMSGGDRGGVAELIASIKVSAIPILCICNDRYDRKLQALANHCLPLNFRKPTRQQMAKRLRQVADREQLDVADSTLEELGERVNGDLRMAVNQLEYMALRSRHLSSEGVKIRALSSAKDEDLRPMAAVDKLLSAAAGRERLEARLDAALSDIDLLPLMVAENYLNHRPTTPPNDPEGVLWMEAAARAADSISEGDRVNVAVRRYQRWQHLPFAAFMGCVVPGGLMHGARSTLAAGEMNFTRFPGWLGKNSTHNRNRRLLEEVHAHMLASRLCSPSRQALRLDYLLTLGRRLTDPLRTAPKAAAVAEVGALMAEYSLSLEDREAALDMLKFKGLPQLGDGIPSDSKGALTREYKKRMSAAKVKAADLVPQVSGGGKRKKVSKRSAALLEPSGMEDMDVPTAGNDRGGEEEVEEEEGVEEEEPKPKSKPKPRVAKKASGKGAKKR